MVEFKDPNLANLICRMMNSPDSRIAAAAKAASKGDPVDLMDLYERLHEQDDDDDVFRPNDDAMSCLIEAFQMNFPPAIGTLGEVELFDEDGNGRYVPEGLGLLLKARNMGYSGANDTLTNYWCNGQRDRETVQNHVDGILSAYDYYGFGFFYFHGIKVDKDLKKARRYFYFSDILGCEEAHDMLARIPENVEELPAVEELKQLAEDADLDRSVLLLQAAVERGDIEAFRDLLDISRENGLGLEEDISSKLGDIEELGMKVDENGMTYSDQVKMILSPDYDETAADEALKGVLDTCVENGVLKEVFNNMRHKLETLGEQTNED